MSRFAFLFFTYEVGPIGPTKTKMRLLSEVTGSTIVENEIFFSVSNFDIRFSEGRLLFRGAGQRRCRIYFYKK